MNRNRIIKRCLICLLAAAVLVTGIFPAAGTSLAYAAGQTTSASQAKAASSITGNQTKISKAYSKSLKITASVCPARGRKVRLQRYSTARNKWVTIKTVTTANTESANISVSIPKKYRKKTNSVWRLYAPATSSAKSAASSDIAVTTRNLTSYKLSARAACIYRIDPDGSGSLIYSKNSTTRRAQASTTKLMTAILLLERGYLNTTTTISAHAAATPYGSRRLAAGDVYKTSDLLYAMLLPSSNDAATAVAERVGGTEANFVAMMNARAAAMGLKNTHFCNPHGLDADGHYTTATELAQLTAHAYMFPEIRQCWATNVKNIFSVNSNKKWTLWSTNAIFSYVSNFLGGKTGTEDNAGCCFAGVYTYKGRTYVTVVLGSGYGFSRWSDTKKLHKYIKKYASGGY